MVRMDQRREAVARNLPTGIRWMRYETGMRPSTVCCPWLAQCSGMRRKGVIYAEGKNTAQPAVLLAMESIVGLEPIERRSANLNLVDGSERCSKQQLERSRSARVPRIFKGCIAYATYNWQQNKIDFSAKLLFLLGGQRTKVLSIRQEPCGIVEFDSIEALLQVARSAIGLRHNGLDSVGARLEMARVVALGLSGRSHLQRIGRRECGWQECRSAGRDVTGRTQSGLARRES